MMQVTIRPKNYDEDKAARFAKMPDGPNRREKDEPKNEKLVKAEAKKEDEPLKTELPSGTGKPSAKNPRLSRFKQQPSQRPSSKHP